MRLAELAADLEQRRIAILKNNAERAKKQMKDAQARYKMKKAQEQLNKFRSTVASYSLIG
jgi:phage shock protein A